MRSQCFVYGGREYVYLSYSTDTLALPPSLTPAEKEVVWALASGASNREVADRRRVSVRTIDNQVASIYRKLGVTSRAELLARVFESNANSIASSGVDD